MFKVETSPYGTLADGREATLYTLSAPGGMRADITNYGGIVTALYCPDKNGDLADVVLGLDSLDAYQKDSPYFGALIGRVGNRLAGGRFSLDEVSYQLDKNENGVNHLHGGETGFDKVVWDAEARTTDQAAELHLRYVSPDGDQGYPGNLTVTVVYRLSADGVLSVNYEATTDAPTPVNLTQHSYFNLTGTGDVLDHQLTLDADAFTPVDDTLIPTGEVRRVAGTAFDFTQGKAIGQDIEADDEQLAKAGGYDHNFVLNKSSDGELTRAARVVDPASGRVLEVRTTAPGVQFYSGNFLDGSLSGKGRRFDKRSGFCLEPQHFPDAPNQSDFHDIVLRPGQTYRARIDYCFSVDS